MLQGYLLAVTTMEEEAMRSTEDEANLEMDWLHRIDCHEAQDRGVPELSFRSADLSQVNASGAGSSRGGRRTNSICHRHTRNVKLLEKQS